MSPGKQSADAWESKLVRDGRGNVVNNLANASVILGASPEWSGIFGYNEDTHDVELAHGGPCLDGAFPRAMRAGDEQAIAIWFQSSAWRLNVTPARALDALLVVARRRSYSPIRAHLKGLVWDRVKRLDGWLVRYCGAEDSPYTRAVGTCWLRSVAARGLRPGAKVDAMLVLEGAQGAGKSTVFALLGGPFFARISTLVGDRAVQLMSGKLIAEQAELDALERAEVSATKAAITCEVDRVRLPYERRAADLPRTCVLAGTCNRSDYLRDETGGRRFWPVRVGAVDLGALGADRDQLLAEAVAEVQAGEVWHLVDPTLQAAQREAAEERRQVDVWEEMIAPLLAAECPGVRLSRVGVTVVQVLEYLGLEKARWGYMEQRRVARALGALGWTRQRAPREVEGRPWGYYPPEGQPPDKTRGGPTGPTSGPTMDTPKTAGGPTGPTGPRARARESEAGESLSSFSDPSGTSGTSGTNRDFKWDQGQGGSETSGTSPAPRPIVQDSPAVAAWRSAGAARYTELTYQGMSRESARVAVALELGPCPEEAGHDA